MFRSPALQMTSMQSLWPYHTYRPVAWDKYYVNDHQQKPGSVTGGVAAGVTVGIFFLVFVFTFACRIYSEYVDRSQHCRTPQNDELPPSIAEDMWACGVPRDPPPPYEIAIKMSMTRPPQPIHV